MNISSSNLPSIFNVSVLVTTTGQDNRIIEKYLIVNIKDKKDFNLTLSYNKVRKRKNKMKFSFVSYFGYLDYGKCS